MATYNTGFLDTGPEPSELLKALMSLGNRQNRDPYTGEEAALRTASSLVDAVTQKKIFDDEQKRAKTARTADMAALRAYSGGQAALPEQYIERGTADPLEKYLAPINLDPQVFGTNAPAIDNYSQNVIPQAPTAQDLMGASNMMPETPQNVMPQAPTADQLMGDPMGMALGGEPLPQELTSQQAMQQAMQQQMVEGVGQGFDYNPAQEGIEGFSQEALQLALQNGEISPEMANNLVGMHTENRVRSSGAAYQPRPVGAPQFLTLEDGLEHQVVTMFDPRQAGNPDTMGFYQRDLGVSGNVGDRNMSGVLEGRGKTASNQAIDQAKIIARGTGIIARMDKQVNDGLSLAEGVPILRRGLSLLESVETGGFANAALQARQYFGVEGADEGELSANLGIAVLSKLRQTFGAAFTAKEGEELKGLSASFGRSAATNKQLLRQALVITQGAINRGKSAAKELGDEWVLNQFADYEKGTYDITDENLAGIFNPQLKNEDPPQNDSLEDDIRFTMKKHNMTREEVLKKLNDNV